MNRKERRAKAKEIAKKNGISFSRAKNIVEYNYGKNTIQEGMKVKLNVKQIKSHPDWWKLRPEYKKFVEDNENTVFTVEYDRYEDGKLKSNNNSMVCLKEDTTEPKWKFFFRDLLIQTEYEGSKPEISVQWNEEADKKMTQAEKELFEKEAIEKFGS